MAEKKEDRTFFIVIAIILIVFGLFFMKTKPKKKTYPLPQIPVTVQPQKELKEYFDNLGIPRNPFIMGGKPIKWKETATGKKSQGFQLTAIVWDEVQPLAVINDEIVTKDQEINGFKVISIEKEKVILEKEKERIELEIFNP